MINCFVLQYSYLFYIKSYYYHLFLKSYPDVHIEFFAATRVITCYMYISVTIVVQMPSIARQGKQSMSFSLNVYQASGFGLCSERVPEFHFSQSLSVVSCKARRKVTIGLYMEVVGQKEPRSNPHQSPPS